MASRTKIATIAFLASSTSFAAMLSLGTRGAHAETSASADAGPRVVSLTPPRAPKLAATIVAPMPSFVATPTPPDPPPTRTDHFHVLDLKFEHGAIALLGTRSSVEREPVLAPRVMGRFALELFEGPTLIERVRFDFPLLGAAAPDAGPFAAARLESRLSSAIGVRFPQVKRGTRLELTDRKTGGRWSLPWPIAL